MWNPFKKKPETRRALDLTGKPYIKPTLIQRTGMKFLYKYLAPYLVNWKTSLAGLSLLGTGIASLAGTAADVAAGQTPTMEAWQAGVASIIAGVGLIMGKDANKTGVAK